MLTLMLILSHGIAQAQVTPEAVIGKIPPMPSQADLIRAIMATDDSEIPASVQNFNMLVEKANQEIDDNASKLMKASLPSEAQQRAAADVAARGQTGAGETRYRALQEAYCIEIVPKWMELCASQRDRAQTLIAEGRIIDDHHAATTGAQPMTAGAQNQAFTMARLALGCQAKVTALTSIKI